MAPLKLVCLEETFAICRWPAEVPLPDWAAGGPFASITRTDAELSVVCPEAAVPMGVPCEPGWRCLRVAGTLNLALVGVLSALLEPLVRAGIGVFVVSTFDTDYLFVKDANLPRTLDALRDAGHAIDAGGPSPSPRGV
jgi:hypothetical protein